MTGKLRPVASRKLFWIALILALFGVSGLGINALHNGRYAVRPLQMPIETTQRRESVDSFIAQLSEDYEIQLEVDWLDPAGDVRRLVSSMDKPSDLELEWAVRSEGRTIAQGNSSGYLYIAYEGNKWSRLRDRLLGINPALSITGDLVARGVGRFEAQAGKRYELSIKPGANTHMLQPLNPRMVVRLSRVFWQRHYSQTLTFAYAGLAAAGIAGLLFIWWGVAALITKNSDE